MELERQRCPRCGHNFYTDYPIKDGLCHWCVAEMEEPIKETESEINCRTLDMAIEQILKDHPEYYEEDTTGWDFIERLKYIKRFL